jgi:pilus assembly protein CpaF
MAVSLNIREKGGSAERLDFEKDVVTIGRVPGNDIVLPKGNVSKQHSKIVNKDGKFIVLDMKSTNGTFVNGKKIDAPQVIRPTDKIYIGDFVINVDPDAADEAPAPKGRSRRSAGGSAGANGGAVTAAAAGGAAAGAAVAAMTSPGTAEPDEDDENQKRMPASLAAAARKAKAQGRLDPRLERYNRLLKEVHDRLIEYMDLRRLNIDKLGDEQLWTRTERAVSDIIDQMTADGEVPRDVDPGELKTDILNEALGLGPLEQFLAQDDIGEIMVNHANQIYIERDGKITLSEKTFSSNTAVIGVIERIVSPIGRRIDESSPLVDARLKDGSRVNAIIPPLALKGPCITIRKFKREALKVSDLVKYKTITPQMAQFLEACIQARKNIIISGGTGSGKTTTLNIISSFIPEGERIVTVEDAAELQLPQEHWIQLETRPANLEGKGQITIRDLVKNCLRMRPDRIVVGECRGGEALDMLQAMNTGHDGSLTTCHANTPRDALARLETMVLMSGMELPIRAIREQISSAVDIICQQTRFSDGSRKITHISEVSGMEVDIITLQDIFLFKQEGFDANGKVAGRHISTGFIPKFYDDLQRRGIPVNMEIFREE